MKDAIIDGTRISQIKPTGSRFPVAPSLQWVEVPDGTTTRDTYVDGQVVPAPVPPPPTPEEIAEAARVSAIRADVTRVNMINRLKTATLAQISTWVDSQIDGTTAPQVRDQTRAMFKRILAAIALDARS